MSKHNNVNPGRQYKVAGRERVGEDVVPQDHKQAYLKNRENQQPANKRKGKKR